MLLSLNTTVPSAVIFLFSVSRIKEDEERVLGISSPYWNDIDTFPSRIIVPSTSLRLSALLIRRLYLVSSLSSSSTFSVTSSSPNASKSLLLISASLPLVSTPLSFAMDFKTSPSANKMVSPLREKAQEREKRKQSNRSNNLFFNVGISLKSIQCNWLWSQQFFQARLQQL